jgi:hypothetical protein
MGRGRQRRRGVVLLTSAEERPHSRSWATREQLHLGIVHWMNPPTIAGAQRALGKLTPIE